MTVMLLTAHHLEFLSLKGGCRGSSESTLVKMSNCWKSHAAAQLFFYSVTFSHELIHFYILQDLLLIQFDDRLNWNETTIIGENGVH